MEYGSSGAAHDPMYGSEATSGMREAAEPSPRRVLPVHSGATMLGGKHFSMRRDRDIIVCLDGTANDLFKVAEDPGKTNPQIMGFYLASPATDMRYSDKRFQEVLYFKGVGTANETSPGFMAKLGTGVGGAFGKGVRQNVARVLSRVGLLLSVSPGARIYLIGFSRGAFTALWTADVMKRVGLPYVGGADFEDLEKWNDKAARIVKFYEKSAKTLLQRGSIDENTFFSSKKFREEMNGGLVPGAEVVVDGLGLFDPVSSFEGFRLAPDIGFSTSASKVLDATLRKPHIGVANIFEAVALNEVRAQFPLFYLTQDEKYDEQRYMIRCAFLGNHSAVGGVENDLGTGVVARNWMTGQFVDKCNLRVIPEELNTCMTIKDPSKPVQDLLTWENSTWEKLNMKGPAKRSAQKGPWHNFHFHESVLLPHHYFPNVRVAGEANVFEEWGFEPAEARGQKLPERVECQRVPDKSPARVWKVQDRSSESIYVQDYEQYTIHGRPIPGANSIYHTGSVYGEGGHADPRRAELDMPGRDRHSAPPDNLARSKRTR